MQNKIFRKIFKKYNYFTSYFSVLDSEKCVTKLHILAYSLSILEDIRNVRKEAGLDYWTYVLT